MTMKLDSEIRLWLTGRFFWPSDSLYVQYKKIMSDWQNYYLSDFYMVCCLMGILPRWLSIELIDKPNEKQFTSVAEFNNLLLLKS